LASELAEQLTRQLPREAFRVFENRGRFRAPNGDAYIPDVAVVPAALTAPFRLDPARFEVYDAPVPFVAEVWSPKTGTFDIDVKLPAYRLRGDAEIWRLHPIRRSITVWRRLKDGSYTETSLQTGTVRLHDLPRVVIDLDALFAGK
jgi:Uma2 family endonuclease